MAITNSSDFLPLREKARAGKMVGQELSVLPGPQEQPTALTNLKPISSRWVSGAEESHFSSHYITWSAVAKGHLKRAST